jgi:hypothetical protein
MTQALYVHMNNKTIKKEVSKSKDFKNSDATTQILGNHYMLPPSPDKKQILSVCA